MEVNGLSLGGPFQCKANVVRRPLEVCSCSRAQGLKVALGDKRVKTGDRRQPIAIGAFRSGQDRGGNDDFGGSQHRSRGRQRLGRRSAGSAVLTQGESVMSREVQHVGEVRLVIKVP